MTMRATGATPPIAAYARAAKRWMQHLPKKARRSPTRWPSALCARTAGGTSLYPRLPTCPAARIVIPCQSCSPDNRSGRCSVPSNASEQNTNPVTIRDLARKRVLITGASSGIGSAMAHAFAANGAAVAVHYNSDRAGADAVVAAICERGGKAVALRADLTEAAAPGRLVQEAASALDGLDILVNNAGGPVAL